MNFPSKRVLLLAIVFSFTTQAADRLELEGTEIIGNQELPKVLYIVPWKKPSPIELEGRPINSLLEEKLAPIDREVFRRQLSYYQTYIRNNELKQESSISR